MPIVTKTPCAIPVEQALPMFAQVAEALEAAPLLSVEMAGPQSALWTGIARAFWVFIPSDGKCLMRRL